MTVSFVASAILPTQWGQFTIHGFEDESNGKEHVALVFGEPDSNQPLLCRVHSECLTGDCMFSLRCDCGPQLQRAMESVAKEGRGIILYLRQEGRGIGLLNKIKAYALQDTGADTVEANVQLGFDPDLREYQICKPMFDHFGIKSLRLMTNNPEKIDAITEMGIEVTEIVPIHTGSNPHNENYLAVKVDKMGHINKPT
ncbi:GTP cyclohydrolase II [Gammaproteobacteria bacterium]|nr:GTP cyclohydrolase II [Pseudomonadales bacterium]MBT5719279.1 GTP cyclohydrolase II [Gammaproteobacteria bacterium]MDC3267682.1 GTP cyclohydrolase II [bacterium]MBT6481895.1 GTP cyclohydrolase II [Gammaproteobacteria bacterium]MBT7226416.1 GTP cyclohydrolase II [Gammaproteobacteria bacterium]